MQNSDFQDAIELTGLDVLEASLPQGEGSAMAELATRWSNAPPFEILEPLSSSEHSEVLLAREVRLQRLVAMKKLRAEQAGQAELRARFLHEAQITAQLNHPYIVPVYQLSQGPEGLFYTMKPVQGDSLRELSMKARASQSLPNIPEALRRSTLLEHFLKVCDAIAYAHSRRVIHRELKADHIVIGPFHEVYVTDWSQARLLESHETPESAETRSDQVSLGLMLLELISLKDYAGQKGFPAALMAIVQKATAPEPGSRYPDLRALAADLRRFLKGEPVLAAPENLDQKIQRWVFQNRRALLLSLLLLLGLSTSFSSLMLWQQTRSQALARQREQVMNRFFNQVSAQSQNIDTHFLQIESWLEGLSRTLVYYLEAGPPSAEPYHLTSRFTPPDLAVSKQYRGPTSIDWPIWAIAWNVSEQAVAPRIRKLIPARHDFKRLLLRSAGPELPADHAAQRQLIAEQGGPVVWATVVLKEGVLVYYPGKGHYEPRYDPRDRPFYKLAAHKSGRHWGNPYIDGAGMGLILPCSMALYNSQREFLGTATLEMKFDYLIESLLSLTGNPAIRQTYLVDPQGRVVVHSGQQNRSFPGKIFPDLALPQFEQPEVRAAILKGESGFRLTDQDKNLYAFARMDATGWTYVVRADYATLLKGKP